MSRVLAALLGFLILTHCAGTAVDENDPASVFKSAEDEISSDHYQLAIDKLRMVKSKFPYSKYSAEAQLRMGDVYFLQESYTEAALAYESFRDLYPKHEKTSYAMFRVGLSHYKDLPSTVARDLTPAAKALEALEEFLKRFPDKPESAEARTLVAQIRERLAEKEIYIGDFYSRWKQPESARRRYKKAAEQFPGTRASEIAKEKLTRLEKQS